MLNRNQYAKQFGKYLKSELKRRKIKSKVLADWMQITDNTMSRWIQGENCPSMWDYYRIRLFFDYMDSFGEKYLFSNDLEKFEHNI